jgi:hypothetical protein
MRKRRNIVIAGAALVLVAGALGIGNAIAGGGESEGSVTGPAADRAVAAALKVTGGGTANAVERDSEDGATWEVEVTTPNGATVDVRLDAGYGLVVVEGDSEREDGGDSSDAGESE